MNELIRLSGCLLIAVGWVALPLTFSYWDDSEHENVANVMGILIVCEIIFFTWVLYYKF
jgi:hypothetical protein